MLFNSSLFLFVFLPIVLGLFYWLLWRNSFRLAIAALTACSLFFYGFWNPAYLPLLLISIVCNYAIGRSLYLQPSRILLSLGIAFNLSLIAYFKYAHFMVSIANEVTGNSWVMHQILLPLGISFFTFQQITWLVDVNKGGSERPRFIDYVLFVSFFPQLIAGPIVHHQEMMPQFKRLQSQNDTLGTSGASGQPGIFSANFIAGNISVGLTILCIGLFKKVIIADSLALYASPIFQAAELGITLTSYEAWLGALAYSLQLYFDFSGYSDMAIGIARLFGITLPMNFNSPYKSRSIIEFWRRWHMTLSRFLRDYLYIPLGGSRTGSSQRYRNLAITMVLGGLWHGAGWTFVVWGALHGTFLIINQCWRARTNDKDERHMASTLGRRLCGHLTKLAAQALTLICIVCAWVVFRAVDIDAAIAQLASMAGLNGIALPVQLASLLQGNPWLISFADISFGKLFVNELIPPLTAISWIAGSVCIVLFMPNTQQIMHRFTPVLEPVSPASGISRHIQWSPSWPWFLVIQLMSLYTLLHLSRVSEFLYFQF
ncbi:MBOAT family O-acyltransferase [Granulosicoccus antarcticus]|uniref:Probable alginate O-acetylase n=1 Tax=Granulosicoccus antarcticus IMCC3135 TaxID=1192854 RepID=A0A2Z2P4A2_9GAMM|nr:MBOAT family O-acyltransferase [Granulosicoccus antarcticus]ASJ75497.1 Peptidoglycan O-acetyltransferase [Granulosicoccus antarcticus IMCC3135]